MWRSKREPKVSKNKWTRRVNWSSPSRNELINGTPSSVQEVVDSNCVSLLVMDIRLDKMDNWFSTIDPIRLMLNCQRSTGSPYRNHTIWLWERVLVMMAVCRRYWRRRTGWSVRWSRRECSSSTNRLGFTSIGCRDWVISSRSRSVSAMISRSRRASGASRNGWGIWALTVNISSRGLTSISCWTTGDLHTLLTLQIINKLEQRNFSP